MSALEKVKNFVPHDDFGGDGGTSVERFAWTVAATGASTLETPTVHPASLEYSDGG